MTHTASQECCDRENYLLMQKQFLCADMRYIFLRESKSAVQLVSTLLSVGKNSSGSLKY